MLPCLPAGRQSFRMRFFIFYSIEIEKVNKTPQYFCNHLNDPVKGFRSKICSSIPDQCSMEATLQRAKVLQVVLMPSATGHWLSAFSLLSTDHCLVITFSYSGF
jgi:hypothetical protein